MSGRPRAAAAAGRTAIAAFVPCLWRSCPEPAESPARTFPGRRCPTVVVGTLQRRSRLAAGCQSGHPVDLLSAPIGPAIVRLTMKTRHARNTTTQIVSLLESLVDPYGAANARALVDRENVEGRRQLLLDRPNRSALLSLPLRLNLIIEGSAHLERLVPAPATRRGEVDDPQGPTQAVVHARP